MSTEKDGEIYIVNILLYLIKCVVNSMKYFERYIGESTIVRGSYRVLKYGI